LLQKIISK